MATLMMIWRHFRAINDSVSLKIMQICQFLFNIVGLKGCHFLGVWGGAKKNLQILDLQRLAGLHLGGTESCKNLEQNFILSSKSTILIPTVSGLDGWSKKALKKGLKEVRINCHTFLPNYLEFAWEK